MSECIYCGSTEDLRDFPACASAGKSNEMICAECEDNFDMKIGGVDCGN